MKLKLSNKTLLVLAYAYVFAAFSWWTVILVRTTDQIYIHQLNALNNSLHQANQVVFAFTFEGKFESESALEFEFPGKSILRYDKTKVDSFISQSFPDLEIHFQESNLFYDSYKIQIKQSVLQDINDQKHRKMLMLLGEGIVFMTLLVWGFSAVSKSYKQRIELDKQKNNFLLAVTHELKSPLASAKVMLESMKRRTLTEDLKTKMLTNSISEINRLDELIENVLLVTRLDSQSLNYNNSALNLSQICHDVVFYFKNKYEMEDAEFELNIEEGIYIFADAMAIRSVLINLVDNAIKYSKEAKHVGIKLTKKEHQVFLKISDKGIGIKEEEKSKLFRKFYRIGNEETRTTKGTGLGLYIVKNVLTGHEAEVFIEDNAGGGTIFVIQFKAFEA